MRINLIKSTIKELFTLKVFDILWSINCFIIKWMIFWKLHVKIPRTGKSQYIIFLFESFCLSLSIYFFYLIEKYAFVWRHNLHCNGLKLFTICALFTHYTVSALNWGLDIYFMQCWKVVERYLNNIAVVCVIHVIH